MQGLLPSSNEDTHDKASIIYFYDMYSPEKSDSDITTYDKMQDILMFLASVQIKLHIPEAAIKEWVNSHWHALPRNLKHPGRAQKV